MWYRGPRIICLDVRRRTHPAVRADLDPEWGDAERHVDALTEYNTCVLGPLGLLAVTLGTAEKREEQ